MLCGFIGISDQSIIIGNGHIILNTVGRSFVDGDGRREVGIRFVNNPGQKRIHQLICLDLFGQILIFREQVIILIRKHCLVIQLLIFPCQMIIFFPDVFLKLHFPEISEERLRKAVHKRTDRRNNG